MRTLTAAVFALLIAVPALAQNRFLDLTGNVVWLDPSGGGSFEDLSNPADIEFEGSVGYGAAANFFLGDRVSLEIAASAVNPDTTVRRRAVGGSASGSEFQIIPVTGILQFHFAPNAFLDPYIGGGAAYVLLDSVDEGLDADIDRIDFEDDAGFVVNAGVNIRVGNRFGIVLDGKYVPVESSATLVPTSGSGVSEEAEIDISPIILSAGLSLRF